jgi:SagB-type dehydrogenase family enzyme
MSISTGSVHQVSEQLHVNPVMQVTFDEEQGVLLNLPLEGRFFEITDADQLAALSYAGKAATVPDLLSVLVSDGLAADTVQAEALIADFIDAGVFRVGDDQGDTWAAAEHWINRGWTEALLFHLACHRDSFRDDNIDDIDAVNDVELADRVTAGIPEVWRHYSGHAIDLPTPVPTNELPDLDLVLMARRSNRPWKRPSMTLRDIATTAAHACAEMVRVRRTFEQQVESRPSVSLNSPFTALELYLVAHRVDGLSAGLYHYEPDHHRLRQLRTGDMSDDLQRMCVGQERAGSGSATWVVTSVWERFMWRYPHPSGYRTLMINVGEFGQKLLTYATALGQSTFVTPAFDDEFADVVLGIHPDTEAAVEVIGVG